MAITTSPITSETKIDYVGSPKHFRNTSDQIFNRITMEIYVWSGALSAAPTTATFSLEKSKVSSDDDYVMIEMSQYIAPFIQSSVNFEYGIQASNECVYWQAITKFWNNTILKDTKDTGTRLATKGYNWYYEGENHLDDNHGSFGFYNAEAKRYYHSNLMYYYPSIVLTGATNTANMVTRTLYSPSQDELRCTPQPALIVYKNKQGFYFIFSIFGNIDFNTNFTREEYEHSTRNPDSIVRSSFHATKQYNINSRQLYTVNTGLITEKMGEQIEEIYHSDEVYLIIFNGELVGGGGVTVDSTLITVDSTLITVDSASGAGIATTEFKQIPVKVINPDFNRKLKLNNKADISYIIQLEATNNKKNNIR